jgi:hypothetical protein
MGGDTGRLEGATAEEAVPFPCAARRSFVLRLVAFLCLNPSKVTGKQPGGEFMALQPHTVECIFGTCDGADHCGHDVGVLPES